MSFEDILGRDFPDLDQLALQRVITGRSLVPKGGVYTYGREKTRLVLLRACGICAGLSGGRQLCVIRRRPAYPMKGPPSSLESSRG